MRDRLLTVTLLPTDSERLSNDNQGESRHRLQCVTSLIYCSSDRITSPFLCGTSYIHELGSVYTGAVGHLFHVRLLYFLSDLVLEEYMRTPTCINMKERENHANTRHDGAEYVGDKDASTLCASGMDEQKIFMRIRMLCMDDDCHRLVASL
jgi:hypothetical protein